MRISGPSEYLGWIVHTGAVLTAIIVEVQTLPFSMTDARCSQAWQCFEGIQTFQRTLAGPT